MHEIQEPTVCLLVWVMPYPRCEVNGCSSVQQQRGHVDVPIVGSDMQGRESTLEDRKERNRHTHIQDERSQRVALTSYTITLACAS